MDVLSVIVLIANMLDKSTALLRVETNDPSIPEGCNVVGEYRLACSDIKELKLDSSNTASVVELYIKNTQYISIEGNVNIVKINAVNATIITIEVIRKYLRTIWIDDVTSLTLVYEYQQTLSNGKEMFLRNVNHLNLAWKGSDRGMTMHWHFIYVTLNRVKHFQTGFPLRIFAKKIVLTESHILLKDRHDMTLNVDFGMILASRIEIFHETELAVENSVHFTVEDSTIYITSRKFTSVAFKNSTAVLVKNNTFDNIGKTSIFYRSQTGSIVQNVFRNSSIEVLNMMTYGFEFYNNTFEFFECAVSTVLRAMKKNASQMMNLRVVLQNNFFQTECRGSLDQFLEILEKHDMCKNGEMLINYSRFCEAYNQRSIEEATTNEDVGEEDTKANEVNAKVGVATAEDVSEEETKANEVNAKLEMATTQDVAEDTKANEVTAKVEVATTEDNAEEETKASEVNAKVVVATTEDVAKEDTNANEVNAKVEVATTEDVAKEDTKANEVYAKVEVVTTKDVAEEDTKANGVNENEEFTTAEYAELTERTTTKDSSKDNTSKTSVFNFRVSTTPAPIWLAQTPLWVWILLSISVLLLSCTVCICVAPSLMDCK